MRFNPVRVISLSGGDALVSEQARNCSDRRIMLQQSDGKGVPEAMGMHVNSRFSAYRIERSTQALNASFKVAFSLTCPKEILFIFNRSCKQGFNCRLAKNKGDVFTGFQGSHNKTVRLQIETSSSEFSGVRDTKAGVEQQQHQRFGSKGISFAPVERLARFEYGVDFLLFKRQSAQRIVFYLLNHRSRVLRHPIPVFAELAKSTKSFQFFAKRFAARSFRNNRAFAAPPSGALKGSRTIGRMFLLCLAWSVGSKRGNQIHRNVFGCKAPSLITECRERLQCVEVAPNRRRFQTSRLAIGQVILDRLINSFSLYGVDYLLRLDHRRKHPLGAGPVAGLHRLARTHSIHTLVAPNGAIALRAFATFFGLRAFWRVAPEQENVRRQNGFYQKPWHVFGTVRNSDCNYMILITLGWGGWWGLNPRHPEPQSGATTN